MSKTYEVENAGELKKLLANVPDNAPIFPRFGPQFSPTDADPAVIYYGFSLDTTRESPTLFIDLGLIGLDEIESGEADDDEEAE